MGKRTDAREKFKQVDDLFRARNFAEALVVLDELDQEFPETKNVIYPRAMCLARVGRFDEALDLCRQLKVEFGDPRGEKLMTKIGALRKAVAEKEKAKAEARPAGAGAPPANIYTLDSTPPPLGDRPKGKNAEFSPVFDPHDAGAGVGPLGATPDLMDLGDGSPAIDLAGLDDLFAAKPAALPVAPVKREPPSRKGMYIGGGIAAAVLIVLVALSLALRGNGPAEPEPASKPAPEQHQVEAEAPQYDGPEIVWLNSSVDATNKAMGEDSSGYILFLIYSSSTPSPEIEQMDSLVWSDPTVRYYAQDLVCARIDVDKEPEAKDKWGITRFPTVIVTDYEMNGVYFRQDGFLDVSQFYTAMTDNGIAPQPGETEEFELPKLPVIALVLLPVVYVVATFLPVLFTLLIFGHMPDDDIVTGLLGMLLVGLVSPFLGRWVMRATYQLGPIEIIVYYALLIVHLIAGNWFMTLISGLDMPFFIYLYAAFFKHQLG